jgi:formiminoglutamase
MTSGWPNLSDLLTQDRDAPVGLVGARLGAGSVTPGGCDRAPGLLRATLKRIGRYDIDTGNELSSRIADHGDVEVSGLTIEDATAPIRDAVARSVAAHQLTLLVGGNNAVTRPGVHGLGMPLDKVGLITLDAHFDMRDLDHGLSNGNPVRALIEDGLPGKNIAQIGLAPFANSTTMHRDAVAAGNCIVTQAEVVRYGIAAAGGGGGGPGAPCQALYLDFDKDV